MQFPPEVLHELSDRTIYVRHQGITQLLHI